MNFWEVDELDLKDLLIHGWDIFGTIGLRLFIFTILYDQVLNYGANIFWNGAFGFKDQLSTYLSAQMTAIVGLMGLLLSIISYNVIYSLVSYQALIGKTKYTDLTAVLKNSWQRFLLLSLATTLIYELVLVCLVIALSYVINRALSTASYSVLMLAALTPLFFMVFSFTTKNMGLLKSCLYSLVITKKYWHKTLWFQAALVVILLIATLKPPYYVLFFFGGMIFIYVQIVLLIQFHNFDYLENRHRGSR